MDGPFKGMSREHEREFYEGFFGAPEHCDECGGEVRFGDWPFCHGSPADHERE